MKPVSFRSILICSILCMTLGSCKKNETPGPGYLFKVGIMADAAGFNDRGFNQSALAGVAQATSEIPIYYEALIGSTEEDFQEIIDYFVLNQFDIVITAGFLPADVIVSSSLLYPGTQFVLLDVLPEVQPANLTCAVFDVDQASFPCGFLAAYWSFVKDPGQPAAGYVGGPAIPNINQFSVSYIHGVDFFNDLYGLNVQVQGANTPDFTDTLQAAHLADSLILNGTDVLFAFAGKAGNGALYQVKASGKWGIGVDVDQYLSIPEVGDILLTSCMKEMQQVVYEILIAYNNGAFSGGEVIHGDLANHGVGLAPFHDFESRIPDSIRTEIANIMTGIENGTIQTGW